MDYNESLKLFSWHAFQQDSPKDGYMEISKKFVEHCGGLPLALQVLGSSLLGQCVAVWRSALLKLEAIPNSEIMNKLRISYDSLIDNHDQELFLHIACFFIGRDRDYIVQVLDGCDFYTTVGIVNLIDRCLVTIDRETKVQMHDMIRDMGRGIVRLASEEPGKRSRLWHHKDSFRVLREKNGTQTIEGLAFQMYMDTAKPPINSSERHFDTSAFSGMKKLRLLHLSHVQLDGCYGDFPQDLKWLCWVAFPLDSIPIDFSLEKLVVLEMQYSSLKQIYKGTKYLPSLRVLDLSHSDDITGATDFSLCPNLEKLILEGCANLFSIHESIGNVKRLIYLNMKDCKDLWMLPETILKLQLLETLVISGCTSLGVSSMEMMRSMESLKELEMDEIPISHVQSKGGMVKPWPGRSSSIWSFLPSSLVSLSLSGCNLSDDAFSMGFPDLSSLRRLNLGDNPISTLPSCFKGLTMLDELDFSYCSSLISLEELPEVEELIILIGCTALEIITFQSTWRACIRLDLGGQPNLVEWQYQYKLEPIGKVDMAIINLLELGNLDLESLPAIWLRHPTNPTYQLYPIQGLHEEGVFSTFLPGNDVPGEFFHRIRKGSSSVSFTLPLLPNINIRGLNIFIVYTASDKNSPRVPRQIITKVRNKSKALKWIYGPSFHAIPDEGEDMTLLSHWSMLESQFESGDEVVVSVCERRPDLFNIKEFGVQVVQQEKEEDMTSLPLTHPDFGKSLEPKIELYDPNRENYSDCHFEDSDEDTDNGEQLDGYHTIPAATSADGSDCMPGFRKWKMLVIAAVGLFGRCFITFPGSKRWDTTIHPSLE